MFKELYSIIKEKQEIINERTMLKEGLNTELDLFIETVDLAIIPKEEPHLKKDEIL